MFIKEQVHFIPTIDCGDHIEIDGINREDNVSEQYINKVPQIVLDVNTAVLYTGGFGISQSESRDSSKVNTRFIGSVPLQKTSMILRESTSYSIHKWIGSMANNQLVVYANINSNTCASSMYSLYEAEQLLDEPHIDEVIIIAEERTSFNTIRIFKEHRIDVKAGDGFAIIRLTNKDFGKGKITDTKWSYLYDRNPFKTSEDGYRKVYTEASNCKPHGTGTVDNNKAEEFIDVPEINYKDVIGHTQGSSALLELCMLIDDVEVKDDVLCMASGVGGFYGSCVLHKV